MLIVPKIPAVVSPLFLGWKNIEVGFQTKVYHLAALALVFQTGSRSLRLFGAMPNPHEWDSE